MNIFEWLSIPLGKLMHFIYFYLTFQNYGLALILFTILTRLLMLPLTIKQYQGTAKMQKLNPRIEELRRQYGTDKKRLQEETMKLYQEEKVNPAGGCLPLLIQFPILFSLYPVITGPLRYMLGKSQEQIAALKELYSSLTENTSRIIQEMEMLNYFKTNPSAMAKAEAQSLLIPSDLLNMRFIGMDLSKVPTYKPEVLFGQQAGIYLPLLLIPIIGVLSTYISGKFSMASSAAQSAQNDQAASMGKSMQFIGPVMTLIFSFQLPSGVLIYWIAGYLIQIVQQLFINKYVFKLDNIFTGISPVPIKSKGAGSGKGANTSAVKVVGAGAGAGVGKGASTGASAGKNAGAIAGNGAGMGTGASAGKGAGAGAVTGAGKSAKGVSAAGAPTIAVAGGAAMENGKVSVVETFASETVINEPTMVSKLLGLPGIGMSSMKAESKGGIMHGGVFETTVNIPGITGGGAVNFGGADNEYDGYEDESVNSILDDVYDVKGQYNPDDADNPDDTDDEDDVDGADRMVGPAYRDGARYAQAKPTQTDAAHKPPYTPHIDSRSNTTKNYGSRKHKKKK